MSTPRKDDSQQAVPEEWRATICEIVRAFANDDYVLASFRGSGMSRSVAIEPSSSSQAKAYIDDYGESLVELPPETWDSSIVQWTGAHWEVVVDLFTAESGCSDMILELWVNEVLEGYRFRVHAVYVP